MYAFALKTNKENSAMAPSFCKAKYFGFYDGKNLEIKRNENTCGKGVMNWLFENKVTKLIVKDIGRNPYNLAKSKNFEFYYAGDERIELPEVLENIKNNKFEVIGEDKINKILEKHDSNNHSHNHNGGHNHSHQHKNNYVFL
ncbi:hypothetical protein CRV00_03590 [Malaciobacter molluscorum]|uniref:NifB/NifX family molybdenum-iron cluster-binding protein n=1 Tax=Malaciobacter molluscorum TaxID=1032072 RepID=UPI00100B19DE|nr:NifB/NifX family molybdenum-iron cluster-binding protein [Malaciobacter molluscorum]RXJ95538.1 hypothetical protein CRV00_03590 [Malaciobacter molluscorum]